MHSASLSKQTKPNPHLFRVLTLHCFLLLPKVHVHLWGFRRAGCEGGAAELCHPAGWLGSKQCAPCLQHYLLFLCFPKPLLPKKVEAFEPAPDTADSCPQQEKKIKKKLIPPAGWRRARSGAGRRCPRHGAARSRPLRTRGTCASSHGAG